ncbi:MAG: DUF2441 domain-containing protein [Solirubrobacteraceae bacterium]|nr:DUF2441 domain-containing protein [Solirubrobacteraceae bacterium]
MPDSDDLYIVGADAQAPLPETLELEHPGPLPERAMRLLRDWFPDGVSRHGNYYFAQALKMTPDQASSLAVDLVFETVRRYEFPRLPSRMQTIFAVDSLEDAERFRVGRRPDDAPIFLVSGRVAHRANMYLTGLGNYGAGAIINARDYWSGEQGEVPDLLWEYLLEPPVTVIERVV